MTRASNKNVIIFKKIYISYGKQSHKKYIMFLISSDSKKLQVSNFQNIRF